jgi:hypothetical protein
VAGISLYTYGNQTGFFLFVILNIAFEGSFWIGLFAVKQQNNEKYAVFIFRVLVR